MLFQTLNSLLRFDPGSSLSLVQNRTHLYSFFETHKIEIFIVINDYWQFKTLIFFRNGMEKKPYPQLFFRPPLPPFIFLCSSLGFFIDRDRAVHKKTLLFP